MNVAPPASIPRRPLGNTGLSVFPVAFGAGSIGAPDLLEPEVERLLLGAVDLGINLFDSARAYGFSEERLGRHLKSRRKDILLSTKVGYGVPGVENWTGPCITAGIERALTVMQTDWLDVVHLHSCPLDVLVRGDCVQALQRAVRAGKVRVAAYSGDNQALQWAVENGAFGSVQCSFNLFDQHARRKALPTAHALGRGILCKRALGNAPWRYAERPTGLEAEKYWDRHAALKYNNLGLAWEEFAVRFAAFEQGVSAVLVGTTSRDHLARAVKALQYGPLPRAMLDMVAGTWKRHDRDWPAVV